MKALLLEEYGKVRIVDLPKPEIAENEVLINVKACAICGSDLHGFTGRSDRRRPPLIMGHEAAGVIAEVGATVNGYKVGDRVVFNSSLYCGQCYYCRRGQENMCVDAKVFGVSCADYKLDGAMAEYIKVPAHILYRLPDSLSFVQGAVIEPLSIALHAVSRTRIEAGDTVAVIGAGTIGLMIVKALKNSGAGRIVSIDVDDYKLDCAMKAGADAVINSRTQDALSEIKKLAPMGADVVFEAVGIGATVENALDLVRRGGSVTLVGNAQPRADLGMQKIVLKELRVHGSYACANEYETAIKLLEQGRTYVDDIISVVAPIEEGQTYLDKLVGGREKMVKVVLKL